MNTRSMLAAILMVGGFSFPACAEGLPFASWNIANLHHETGVALRDRAFARICSHVQRHAFCSAADFTRAAIERVKFGVRKSIKIFAL